MDIKSQYDIVQYFETYTPVHKRIYEGRYILSGRDLIVEVRYCSIPQFMFSDISVIIGIL